MPLDLDKLSKELSTLFVSVSEKDANNYKKLQIKLIACNANQDTVVKRLTEVEPIVARKQNDINTKKFALNARKHDIKTKTEIVKKLPTGKERDEAAEELLHNDFEQLINMENDLNDWMVAKNALITTLRKLKTTEQNIKLLKSMLDEQVSKLNIGSIGDPDVAHLQKSLSEFDDLENELGLDDDVESSDEYIEDCAADSQGATHDESEEPSTEPLDSGDSHDASEDLLAIDGLNDSDDESEEPSIAPLDSGDSCDESEDKNEDLISSLIDIDDGVDYDSYGSTDEGDSDSSVEEDEEVTEKQPTPGAGKEEPKTDSRKRTPMEEILGEDLPDDGPAKKTALVEEDVDMSDLLGDFSSDITFGEGNKEVKKPAVEEKKKVKEVPVKSSKKVEPVVVEDDASVGEEYDIESLLDM
jgi:hypothetical protein